MISKKIIDLGLSNLVQFQNGGLYFLKPYEDLKRFPGAIAPVIIVLTPPL